MQPDLAAPAEAPSSPATDQAKFRAAALNGTALYVLAYYLVWGVHQVAQWQMAVFYHLRGAWDPSRIQYTVADSEWWPAAIVGVYGVGPAVCLVLGYAAFWWFWRRERAQRGQFKLLLLWVAFHACNAVFGALLADTFTKSEFWYVPEWLLPQGGPFNVVLALGAGLLQLLLGYFGAVAFLQAHDSKTVMRFANRQRMVTCTLGVPWLVGSAGVALAKLPYLTVQEGLHLLMMGLLVFPLGLGCLNELFSSTVRRPLPTHVAWGLLAVAVVVAVAWRLALSPPVTFG